MSENYKREITCPYCQYAQGDGWEGDCDEDTIECQNEECGKNFTYQREIEVTYSSQKIDCKEGKHEFDEELDTFITNIGEGHEPEGLPQQELVWHIKAECKNCEEVAYTRDVKLTDEEYEDFQKNRFGVKCHILGYKGNEKLFHGSIRNEGL